jgi:imidazolonepropionase-like amidohydrolase
VPIGFGTDAAVFPHGDNAKEFIYMKQAGMSIQAATIINAKILEMDTQIGALEPDIWQILLQQMRLKTSTP